MNHLPHSIEKETKNNVRYMDEKGNNIFTSIYLIDDRIRFYKSRVNKAEDLDWILEDGKKEVLLKFYRRKLESFEHIKKEYDNR